MTPADLRTLIEQLGLSQVGLAREIGTDGRPEEGAKTGS